MSNKKNIFNYSQKRRNSSLALTDGKRYSEEYGYKTILKQELEGYNLKDGFFGNSEHGLERRVFEKPAVAHICIIFSAVIILFATLGFRVQKNDFYSGILITEFALIMLPALIFLVAFRYDLKYVLRLNKTSVLNFTLIFFIMTFAIPIAGLFNLANLWLVNTIFGKVMVIQPPVSESFLDLLVNILVIGGSAGICEEFLFRGVIQRGFERFGAVRSILMAGFLFSLTHLDFQKIFGTFILGALIGFIVYRSNSLYGGMFAHFTNNSLAVIIGFLLTKIMNIMKNAGMQVHQTETDLSSYFAALSQMPKMQLMIAAFFYGFMFLVALIIFAALIYAFIKTTHGKAESVRASYTATSVSKLLWLLPGLALIMGIYIMQVIEFRGVNSWFLNHIRMLLGA